MSRNLPIRVTISLVFRYIVWQFITLIINYKEIVVDNFFKNGGAVKSKKEYSIYLLLESFSAARLVKI